MKARCFILVSVALLAEGPLQAQVILPDVAEATVRAGSNANVDVDEVTTGFQRVKWVQDAAPGNATACAKVYCAWDFTGQHPNTNADLTISITGAASSQLSAMRIWSLDQAYPSFIASGTTATPNRALTWNAAQANDTNFVPALGVNQGTFQMLTNGAFTAHPVANFSAVGTTTVKIPGPWGNLINNNQMVLVVVGTNNAALAGQNGYRMKLNTGNNDGTKLVFPALVGTSPPSITALPDVTVVSGQNSVSNSFTVSDPDGNVANIAPATLTFDGTVVVSASVIGSGANQLIYVTAGNVTFVTNTAVEATVTDENGDVAQRTFQVTVLPQIFPPTISTPANTNTPLNTAVTVPFIIGDQSQDVSILSVTAAVDAVSGNELAGVSLGGSGTNRTVTVTPVAGADGVGIVDLSVADTNGNTSSTSFAVMVLTNRAVFDDHFDYFDGSLFTVSDTVWLRRGNIQPVGLKTLSQAAHIVSGAANDNGYGTLVGAPYSPGDRSVIYITFMGTWSAAPSGNSGAIVALANNSTISSPQVCAIGSTPDVLGDGGDLIVRIANGNGYTNYPVGIALNTPHKIIARYDVDTALATLWVDATNEADASVPSITASDVATPVAVSLLNLNQNGNTGTLSLDDLKVSVVVRPRIIAITVMANNVQIDFTAGTGDATTDFGVNSTTNLTVPFSAANVTITSLGGNVFRATLPASGSQGFYRVFRQPFSF
jgi:hypothetical protein